MRDTTSPSSSAPPRPGPGRRVQKTQLVCPESFVRIECISCRADEDHVQACDECHAKKTRCSGTRPKCSACAKRNQACVYGLVRRRGRGKKDSVDTGTRAREIPIDESDGGTSSRVQAAQEASSARNTIHQDPVTEGIPSSVELGDQYGTRSESPTAMTMPNEDATANRCREPTRSHAFHLEVVTPLPSKAHMAGIFEAEFGADNTYWSVPDVATLMFILLAHDTEAAPSVRSDPATWAMLNASMAIAIRAKAAPASHKSMTEFAWNLYKNAFAMVVPIAVRSHDVLGLEAMLAMAIFISETSDTSSLQYLLSVACQLIRRLELDRMNADVDVDTRHTGRCKMALDTYCGLAQDMIFVHRPCSLEPSAGRLAMLSHLDPPVDACKVQSGNRNLQDCRLQLMGLQCNVDRLVSLTGVKQDLHASYENAKMIDRLLLEWIHDLGGVLQAERTIHQDSDYLSRTELGLRFAFLYARWAVHGFMAELRPSTMELQTQVKESQSIQYELASESIDRARALTELTPGQIWYHLPYPLSAFLALFSAAIQTPLSDHASDSLAPMQSFLRLLQTIRESGGLDLERMLMLCCNMKRIAEVAIRRLASGSQDDLHQPIELRWCTQTVSLPDLQGRMSLAQMSSHAIYYAHGLMGNLPGPRKAVLAVLGDLIPPEWHGGSMDTILGPDLVNAESYS